MEIGTLLAANWSTLVTTSVKLSFTIYKNKNPLNVLWNEFLQSRDLSNPEILIVGEPGTGKTLLGERITASINDLVWTKPGRSEKVEKFLFHLNNKIYHSRIIPGQLSQQSSLGIAKGFNKKLRGIIFVCDWGYTEVRDKFVEKRMWDEEGINTIDIFRKYHMDKELFKFQEICAKIIENHSVNPNPVWLMIAVNKCDLYSNEIESAHSYYHHEINNKFKKEIDKVRDQLGNKLHVDTFPVSSYGNDFYFKDLKVESLMNQENSSKLFKVFIEALNRLDQRLGR